MRTKNSYGFLLLLCMFLGFNTWAREAEPMKTMARENRNYTTFTQPVINKSAEMLSFNKGYEQDPEAGMLFSMAPEKDCFELIGKRTETSKTYIKAGSHGSEIMQQTSTDAMHYRDAAGHWRTIISQLTDEGGGVYTASHQPVPVQLSISGRFTSLGRHGEELRFNNNMELVFAKNDGTQLLLGAADWTHYTAGDDGAYVTNAWPGIDVEMYVVRGAMKTNFYINHAMPQYADGRLLLRDHLELASGMSLYAEGKTTYAGNIAVRNAAGNNIYHISAATAGELANVAGSLQMIDYLVNGNTLDIAVPGSFLNRPAAAYPVIIDPLVSTSTSSTVAGSTYSPAKTVGCPYLNPANVPANVTITDIRWSFSYVASGGAAQSNGGVDYTLGACKSPGGTGVFYYCNLPGGGTCGSGSTTTSIYAEVAGCLPPRQCNSYPLNISMKLYQNYTATAPCTSTYIAAASPLIITVYGRTVESSPVSSAGGVTAVCNGGSVTLSANASYGVPPYTYTWTPGGATGSPVTVVPAATTTYMVTVADVCDNAANASITITVNPIAPITGTNVICTGTTTTMSNSAGAGTWSSSNTSVATIGSSSGIVSGLAPGTATITFTAPTGCFSTTVITITSLPAPITGTMFACVGASTALSSATAGGTWSSAPVSIATIAAGSGLATGVSAGTARITYTTLPGCRATAIVTIHPLPNITSLTPGNPQGCGNSDGKIVVNGLTPGASYTLYYLSGSLVTSPAIANGAGQIVINGLAAGTYSNISVISAVGCVSNITGPVVLSDAANPVTPSASATSALCEGGVLHLNAVSDPGVTYHWTGPNGFTSTLQSPNINSATVVASGAYTVIATLLGCTSDPATTTVTINPVPAITTISGAQPQTCLGNEGVVTLSGLTPGLTYIVSYAKDGIPTSENIAADASGNILIPGLVAGVYGNFFVTSLGCSSNHVGPLLMTDPAPPPSPVVASNAPVCVGLSLLLFGSDATPGGTYTWQGPGGFTSTEQNPIIPDVAISSQGIYTLTYTRLNCNATGFGSISLHNGVALSAISASSQAIEFGDSIQLDVSGAPYYIWVPQNGSLSDDFIHNPVAKPKDSITEYKVYGMNEWGCKDSATITLRVGYDEVIYLPNAFTPNGDGLNDVFRIGKMQYKKLIDFTIYDRWGKEMYHNSYDPNDGWDGTYRGVKQDLGTYYYSIVVESASGKSRLIKGDVILIR